MGLIGIVAESTIPTLITNVMSNVFTQSSTLTVMKITEAANQMKVDGVLDGYATNYDFVNEFQKYMRIKKQCDSSNLTKCFPANFKLGTGEDKDTTTLTMGTKLGKNNIDDDTIGLILANGTSIIFTLRDSTKVSGACERIDPFDNTKDTTGCMSLLYDTNGMGSPNMMGKDIGTINATISNCDGFKIGALCVDASDTTGYPSIASGSDEYNALKAKGLIQYDSGYGGDYWAGALQVCDSKGMRLPTKAELGTMYSDSCGVPIGTNCSTTSVRDSNGFSIAGDYWSSSEYNATEAWIQSFYNGAQYHGYYYKYNGLRIRCVK